MPSPLLSVIMPVFNAENFVEEAVSSLVRQTLSDLEIVIVDDGSTDNSMKIIEAVDDPRVRIVRHSENRGLAAARNTGLYAAHGEYIAWLDADDVSHPRRLERQISFMRKHPEISLCGTWVKTIGKPAGVKWRYPTEPDVLRCRMLFDDPLATSSIVFHRMHINDTRIEFNERYAPAEDYDLWERISRRQRSSNVAQFLTYYRMHCAQTSVRKYERQRIAVWEIQQRQLAELGIEATDDEKALHLELGADWNFRGTKEVLEASEAWLRRLVEANKKAHVYPEPAFVRVIGERWHLACAAAVGRGMHTWHTYWATPLSRHVPFRPLSLTKFFVKCALMGEAARTV